jgi:hypothetical protein
MTKEEVTQKMDLLELKEIEVSRNGKLMKFQAAEFNKKAPYWPVCLGVEGVLAATRPTGISGTSQVGGGSVI